MTTTDCWSTRRKSFIGVTAHWLDPDSLTRFSAALACKQLRGSHTFDGLASALNDIHSEFEIRRKILRTTTDNGRLQIKAFQVFGEDENNNVVKSDEAFQPEEDEEGGGKVEFVDVSAHLSEDDGFENRFGHMLGDPELIAAAILLPKFKTIWTMDEASIRIG